MASTVAWVAPVAGIITAMVVFWILFTAIPRDL
jgi:hypothetical protein